MSRPNLLFLVWDACRLDYAREHAPTLAELASDNLRFSNAITPGTHSLSSHTSVLTGEYPHEHGVFAQTHTIDRTPLLDKLAENGYTRYAVSANGFVSPRYGFDQGFDRFYNTQAQMIYPDGLDVHKYARGVQDPQGEFDTGEVSATDLLQSVATHAHPLKSLINVGAATLTELVGRYKLLQRIPHPRFNRYSEFCYSPSKNTRTIRSILRSADETPWFLFANYMDAHHPYAPSERQQRRSCGRTFSFRELARLADLTHPLEHLSNLETGQRMDEETVETVRNLYAGEVRTADEHLRRLLEILDEEGIREDTLIVITADHGENLGETDRMGETRFGHVSSASEHLMRVPLVIAHPSLEGRDIATYVSVKDLYDLFLDPSELLASGGADLGPLANHEGVVSGQCPGATTDALVEAYPSIADVLKRHLIASYGDGWSVVATSAGETRAWQDGEEKPPDSAPPDVVETAEEQLAALMESASSDGELTEADRAHLKALGYL